MRVTVRAQKPIDFPTGITIDESEWNTSKGYANASCVHASSTNAMIDKWRSVMNDVFARYELIDKRIPAPDEIKDAFNIAIGRKTEKPVKDVPTDFYRVFDKFITEVGAQNNWTKATTTKFKTLKKHFQAAHPKMTFDQLNDAALVKLMKHFSNTGMRNTTVAKQLSFVRWFIRWSHNHGYYSGMVHETFRPKIKGSDASKEIIYLNLDELQTLENHIFEPTESALEHVRDVFVFCCYTGLRYSDAAKLRRSDVKEDHIRVITQKTTDALIIELNTHARAILDKYNGFHFRDDMALPVISNQKMNEHLKTIGRMCGFNDTIRCVYYIGNVRYEDAVPKWQLLTTHCARRTFVVTALQLGIAADVIMKWTGHSSYNAMKPYIAIVDELKSLSMQKFDTI
jgi:integrase